MVLPAAIVSLALALGTVVGVPPGAEPTTRCTADIPPVDPDATASAWCVAGTLDSWKRSRLMGIGQQVDIQDPGRAEAPLRALDPLRPAIVGFDFAELANSFEHYDYDPIPYLAQLADQGMILTASWHVANPATGGDYDDRSWTNISELLDPTTPAYEPFWADYDALLAQARRLQDLGAAVIFRPLHEASGGWFWWGKPDPGDYRRLFAALQERAFAAGVHNLLWAYAANPRSWDTDNDPVDLIPAAIDLIGIDMYDDVVDSPRDRFPLTDFVRLSARAPRMALTEVGPRNSLPGWNPRAITESLRANRLYASYAMLWRDDPQPGNRYQISSVTGGLAWLTGCPRGLCSLRPAPTPRAAPEPT